MSESGKTIAEINARLRAGEAVVMTAQEFKDGIRSGRRWAVEGVDVVTTASMGVMSGTAAAFCLPVAGRGEFQKAKLLWLNGIPAFPGPAPNERLGVVDCVVYGTAHSEYDPAYGGGHLFRDLVERKPILVDLVTDDGRGLHRTLTLDEFEFARIYSFRNSFKNYVAFANLKGKAEFVPTIFSFRPLEAGSGVTVSGCGELSPVQNDPELRVIQVGTKILVNGAPGIVIGRGTRSSPQKPNLSLAADMFGMDPQYMGGFLTSAGPEVITSVAVPIPVLNEEVLADLERALDETIELPVADISDRIPLAVASYAEVWRGNDLSVGYDPDRCVSCSFVCVAESYCPTGAISWGEKKIDERRCFACGACTVTCLGGAFTAELGHLTVSGLALPIIFRQSSRFRALALAEDLRARLLQGEFLLSDPHFPIEHGRA